MRSDVEVDAGKRGISADHAADSLVGESGTILVCKEAVTGLDFRQKTGSVF